MNPTVIAMAIEARETAHEQAKHLRHTASYALVCCQIDACQTEMKRLERDILQARGYDVRTPGLSPLRIRVPQTQQLTQLEAALQVKRQELHRLRALRSYYRAQLGV